MGRRADQAEQILSNPLLDELLAEYSQRVYYQWGQSVDTQQREALHGQYKAISDIEAFIRNKCEGIIRDGS